MIDRVKRFMKRWFLPLTKSRPKPPTPVHVTPPEALRPFVVYYLDPDEDRWLLYPNETPLGLREATLLAARLKYVLGPKYAGKTVETRVEEAPPAC